MIKLQLRMMYVITQGYNKEWSQKDFYVTKHFASIDRRPAA